MILVGDLGARDIVGLLFFVGMLVALLLWATRHLNGQTRCPECGVDREKRPHLPRCRYWSD